MPARPHQLEPAVDLMKSVLENGTVRFEVPEGEHILYAGSWREGHRRVVRGAKGASGPVVDHFNRDSVEKYLDRMSSRLTPTLGGDLGDHFRAMFCDSLELGQANWTGRLTEEFEKRRGYSPGPYLHLMVDSEPVAGGTEFIDSVCRLRYDFNVTVIELFMENFMETFTGWCNRQGVRSRAQAYGRESHPVDTSFLVDLPEGETWIWGAEKYSRPTMINRYVASAAHLSGKRLVSSEAMTNPFTPFRVLPNLLKRTDDLNFLSGITHSVLHGYNYSPPEAGFPGWVQFGCYFSDQNSLWPYFKYWSTYNARVSQVLQSSDAQARVALFTPEADIWSEQGRLYLPFAERERPGYLWDVWEALHQNGFNAEYVSDAILSRAEVKNGQVQVGSRVYEAVILIDVKSLLPGTAERLMEFAEQGVKIAFVGERPYRSPSFRDATANDEIVRSSIGAALESDTADLVGPPPEGGIVDWAGDVMSRFSVLPDVQISAPNSSLSQIYHRLGDRDIFFFVNSSETEAQSFFAKFATGRKVPWVWDPGTGQRRPYHWKESPAELKIHLDPLESLLLVFEAGSSGQAHPETRPSGESGLLLSPTWDVSFTHAITGEKFELSTDELIDLAESDETELNSLAGTIVYKASFESQDQENPWLDLGLVHGVSEVRLNGVPQGVRWYGRHLYNIMSGLKGGENQIEVKVTTHLGNYVRTLKDNPSAARWASWYPLESLGMLGPVKLLPEGSAD
jgi:hypothetical protein